MKVAIIILITLPALILIIAFTAEKHSCYQIAKKLNYECSYSVWTGCVLDDGNRKFLLEQLREVRR